MRENYITARTEADTLKNKIEINGVQFEIGPDLDNCLWSDISIKLADMNNQLEEGEELWRTISADEFRGIGKDINKIWKESGRSNRETFISEMVKKLGFKPDSSYWAGSCYNDGEDNTNVWSSRTGYVEYASKKTNSKSRVRFIR